jgi:hypothetical protein
LLIIMHQSASSYKENVRHPVNAGLENKAGLRVPAVMSTRAGFYVSMSFWHSSAILVEPESDERCAYRGNCDGKRFFAGKVGPAICVNWIVFAVGVRKRRGHQLGCLLASQATAPRRFDEQSDGGDLRDAGC